MEAKKITFRGVEYPSQSACARANGIMNQAVIHRKIKAQCTYAEALEQLIAEESARIENAVRKAAYKAAVRKCAIDNSIPLSKLEKKLKSGLEFDAAVEQVKKDMLIPRKGIPVSFRGKKYNSQLECAKAYGVNATMVRKRTYETNCTWAEAMEFYLLEPEKRPYKQSSGNRVVVQFRGATYPSQKACAEAYGLNPITVRSRSYDCEISFEKAMEYFVSRREKRASA